MNIRGRNKITPEFNMSSMTDIVFLLLIFFMIASTLVSAEAIDLLLPKSSSKTTQTKSVSVSINKDKCPNVKPQLAKKFTNWVVSASTQQTIADFRLLGQALFIPNAGK